MFYTYVDKESFYKWTTLYGILVSIFTVSCIKKSSLYKDKILNCTKIMQASRCGATYLISNLKYHVFAIKNTGRFLSKFQVEKSFNGLLHSFFVFFSQKKDNYLENIFSDNYIYVERYSDELFLKMP